MRNKGVTYSRKARYVLWTISIATLAAAAAAPAVKELQEPPSRKTTDAPVAAKGKMGQELFLAIVHGDHSAVQSLIDNGADPNSRNGLEFTPLDIAAASHQTEVMQSLMKAGAVADAPSAYGTPLNFAAAYGNVEGANLLISKGANINNARSDGMTVLIQAANVGATPIVGELLKRNADVNAKDEDGATALTYAARGGHEDVGRMLLAARAPVDVADAEHQTPLMAAAINGHAGFVKLLLDSGAKPDERDAQGRTALILAAEYGDYPAVVRALLHGNADAKATDKSGATAAAYAAARGHTKSEAVLGKPSAASLAAARTMRSPGQAARLSLKLIQASMMEFNRNTSCVSCHQEGLGRIATGCALTHGFPTDQAVEGAESGRINGMLAAMKPLHLAALQNPHVMMQVPLIEINEVTTIDSWLLAGMAAHKQRADGATGAMAMVLARQQSPDGSWSFSVPREPMQSSFFTFTALAARSLSVYAPKSDTAEVNKRLSRAKKWLLHSPAKDSEDRASRLLGLKWVSASVADRRKAMNAILADQRPDGGWSQLPTLQSDAYATGQALYAMHEGGGLPVTSPAYKRGVRFLLRTQDRQGSWFVNKRAIAANNYFDAGFPYGSSQFASFNGTCWATMALMETTGAQKVAGVAAKTR